MRFCQKQYGLDPAHYYSSPGLSWDTLLKKTGIELELLTDINMLLFIVERGMRGGIVMVSKRHAKANSPPVPGHNPNKPNTFIMDFDANNLYGWAMRKALPVGNFKWMRMASTEEEIIQIRENEKAGWILEVDLEYPEELHEQHNDYPLAAEKKAVQKEWLSPYQKNLMKGLNLNPSDCKKLSLTLQDKNNYVVHYRNLQFYFAPGMKLKRVYRVLEFEQKRWMEPYIRMNTKVRKKAKSAFEKNFYKLMNNSVFGETMENLRNRTAVKLVRSHEKTKLRKLIASPLYSRHEFFANNLAGINMCKSRLFLNKLVYIGMTILENSKLLMYDFFCNTAIHVFGVSHL